MDELVQLRKDLKESNLQLEKERETSRSLGDMLAVSQSDFLKATTQIIDLRGMIATDGSDDEADEWNPTSTPLTPRTGPNSPHGAKTVKLHKILKRSRRLPKTDLLSAFREDGSVRDPRSPLLSSKDPRITSVPSTPTDQLDTDRQPIGLPSERSQSTSRKRQFAESESYIANSVVVPDIEISTAVFDRNLSGLRVRLRQGIKVRLWEDGPGCHVHSLDCLLCLDKTHETLTFSAVTPRRGTFSLFAQRTEVLPMRSSRPIITASSMSVIS